jgi:hypothetical protein
MLGQWIDSLDDPDVAIRLVAALEEPLLLKRLTAAAEGRPVADVIASTVHGFPCERRRDGQDLGLELFMFIPFVRTSVPAS